ncbi:MAG: MFS transporter [Caldilineaceae bacterium]
MTTRTSRVINVTPFYFGWLILVAGTLGIVMMGPSQTFTVGLFTDAFVNELGISRSNLSLIYGAATLGASFMVPITGRMVDRHGPRRMILIVSLIFGLACIGMSQVNGIFGVLIGVLALRGFGFGSMQLVSNNLIAQWFIRKRGLVMGLAGQSLAISLLLYPLAGDGLIAQIGWRNTWIVFGLLVWLVMLPVGVLLFRDRPELYGLLPDGDIPVDDQPSQTRVTEENWTAQQATRTFTFWVFFAALSVMTMVLAGLVFHQTSLFEARGLSRSQAVQVYQAVAYASIVGNLVMGRLLDKFEAHWLTAGALVFLVAALIMVQTMHSWWGAVGYGMLSGLCSGSFRVIDAVVWAKYFGRRYLGAIRGVTMFGTIGGTALGAYPLGWSVDRWGSYDPMLDILVALTLVIALILLFVKRPVMSVSQ